MDDTKSWLLEHARCAATEGRSVLVGTIATCLALANLPPFFFPQMWHEDRFLFVALYGLLAAIVIVGVVFGVQNIRSGGTFYCRLSKDQLDCHSPAPDCGETFSIAVSE